ncbi:MAG: alanine--tRNA ligase [Armatimonadota bacterium]
MMTGNEIREAFLRFFAQHGHKVLPSSSLVPDDPTTLFTTAGMQQFVPWFRREMDPPYGSVATVQKCLRTDDLDNVGRIGRYHTFFEMLGNFSFGDYFKKETLRWGWEFSTLPQDQGGVGFDPEHIWVTYYQPKPGEPYQEDLEARDIWLEIGVPEARIIPLGKKENWWGPVGDSGPCGPCSEMHYDLGEHLACGPDCSSPACGCSRWLEFWNHVFQQFNFQDGEYLPLPVPGIDTGAGLDRIASIVQGVPTNYDTDIIAPIMDKACDLAGARRDTPERDMAAKVIADHLRCAAFAIADGVLPSNAKRGYVVRRIIRRAYRYGRTLGFDAPFLHGLVPTLVGIMGGHYHELRENERMITDTLRAEEERFAATLERGEELLGRLIVDAKAQGAQQLNGEDVFTLYDTFGFPRELTEETALEAGLGIDEAGFTTAMQAAREKAKASGKFNYEGNLTIGSDIPATEFLGYQTTTAEVTLEYFSASDDRATAVVVLDKTPFYATSGGQCTDFGALHFDGAELPVIDVAKDKLGRYLHTVDLSEHETFAPGPRHTVTARVDVARRDAIRRAHTSTHLLHWALHLVLGEHAKQAGSLVEEDVLRFDFSHPRAMTAEEIRRVEDLVYQKILTDAPVAIRDMSLQEARKEGYTALFGEKYGDWVRTVNVGGGEFDVAFSRELCGGTHLERTGQAGFFKIVSESSVAAGIRRIEALTGVKAVAWAREQAALVQNLSALFKVPGEEIVGRVEGLQRELRDAQQQINELKVKAAAGGGTAGPQAEELGGVQAIVAELQDVDAATLGNIADQYLNKLQHGIVVLASAADGNAFFAVKVSKDLAGKLHAGNIVREVAKIAGGGGGGRPDFAQAGGREPDKIPAALEKARELIAG